MPSINEVLERVNRARPDAIDDGTKAGWLLELDGQLYREVILRHAAEPGEEEAQFPRRFPEDGDEALLVGEPYDGLYDLYVLSRIDFLNRETEQYNNSALAYNAALDEWKKAYHRSHAPLGAGGYRNVF